jgi:GT2 family glycosyltransferase
MLKQSRKVFISLPVHNRISYTKRCLQSIRAQKYKNIETILVDDGSNDGTFGYIRKHHPEVHVIRGDGNLWWTKSIFLATEYALAAAKKDDCILLMNNDCYFGDGYINQLLRTHDKYPKSIIGSINVRSNKPTEVVEAGVRIHWPTGLVYSVAEKISTKLSYYKNMNVVGELDALPGKGTLIPVEVFSLIGNFNYQKLPHYISDYEFMNRAKRAGFDLLVDTKAIVKHHWEATGMKVARGNGVIGYGKAWNLMFGRKSMNNIVDWINFLLLTCPDKYLYLNLYTAFWRTIGGVTRMFPFILLKPLIPLFTLVASSIFHLINTIYKKLRHAFLYWKHKYRKEL